MSIYGIIVFLYHTSCALTDTPKSNLVKISIYQTLNLLRNSSLQPKKPNLKIFVANHHYSTILNYTIACIYAEYVVQTLPKIKQTSLQLHRKKHILNNIGHRYWTEPLKQLKNKYSYNI